MKQPATSVIANALDALQEAGRLTPDDVRAAKACIEGIGKPLAMDMRQREVAALERIADSLEAMKNAPVMGW